MKKIIFLSILVLVIALISAEKYATPASQKNFNEVSKLKSSGSKGNTESFTQKKSAADGPRILNILIVKKGSSALSPSLWWSYQHSNSGQTGC